MEHHVSIPRKLFNTAMKLLEDGYYSGFSSINEPGARNVAEAIMVLKPFAIEEMQEQLELPFDEVDPGEMDGDHDSCMASIGWGTDEDYGAY